MPMNYEIELRREAGRLISRRWFFRECGLGFGAMALANLLLENRVFAASPTIKAAGPLVPKQPPFPSKAKRII